MTRQDAPQASSFPKRRRLRLSMLFGGVCVVAACLAARYYWGAEEAAADSQDTRSAQPAPRPHANDTARLKIVATVNGQDISREDLARECLRHYGDEVLEKLVNKYLIQLECQRRKIEVTRAEVNDEIKRMADRFSLPVDQWLKMLSEERGVSPEQYAGDIVWPTLALRKLAGDQLEVTQEELVRQYEAQFGPAVKARLIVLEDARTAEKLLAQARAHPDQFGQLAKEHSADVPSAAANGLIQPIRRHLGPKQIEDVAFGLMDGEISEVVQVGEQYVILKCEEHLPARGVTFEKVKMKLIDSIREQKLRKVAGEIFEKLQQEANVVNVMNDPQLRAKMPGVAAVVNGRQVSIRELAEVCIQRHGEEVLEGTVNRKLLEQEVARRNIQITDADLDEEIQRAAARMLPAKADGSPDVEKWLELVTDQQNVSADVYRRDSVWPSVALRKLVSEKVEVTDEDLQKGYEANYGPRVRCLAIVLNNSRRALQVWEKARANPSPDFFGDLAEQYSVEASTRALRGEVPPIQKHGGQPTLEKQAFAMKEGELSNVIQVGPEQYVILLCLGRTDPVEVDADAVRKYLRDDIYEKKLRLAMADQFHKIQDRATVDNYVAGTSRSPKSPAQARPTVANKQGVPALAPYGTARRVQGVRR